MKNLKFFSRILFAFVLVFAFSFNCFAYSISDYSPVDDIISNDSSNEVIMDIMSSPSLLTLSEPNYDFDPSSLPLVDMPSYVQDIAYTSVPNIFGSDEYLSNVPFFAVLVTGTYIRVVAGYNLCLGRFYSTSNGTTTRGMTYLCSFSNLGSSKYTVCYSADYNLDLSVKVPWHSVEPTNYGSSGYIKRYSGLGLMTTASFDLYLYGANYGKSGSDTQFSVGGGEGYQTFYVAQNSNGFASGRFLLYQDDFEFAYFQSFTPKPLSQIEAETQKGIWDSIKSIPDLISDKLKGLFIPEDGFFSEYFNNLQTFFSEKLGFLVYPFDFIITFLNNYLNIGEGDGTLHLPDFEIMNVKIFNQTDFNLKNAMSSFLGEYYNIYFAFVDFIILVGLVNLSLKKFNSITGGNNE